MDINKHFKREPKFMTWFFLAIPFIGLIAAFILPQFEIDKCLDNGGSFDYQNCECDFNENHQYTKKHTCK